MVKNTSRVVLIGIYELKNATTDIGADCLKPILVIGYYSKYTK